MAKCSVKDSIYVRVVVFGAGALLQVWRTRRAPLPAPPCHLQKSEWRFRLFRGRCGLAGAPSTSRPVLTKSLLESLGSWTESAFLEFRRPPLGINRLS